ncbi:spore cortex biosynthesis protein YabQ [Thomasclavelia sp.]|uniref:spore cortex biosynthesis protein YabQ n=1 Tax=Thomasclavelia sp. TaxID=3025757 RepID=UPI00345DCA20
MDLINQLQGISYSLVFGFLFTFVYSLINRVFYKYHQSIFRYIIQIITGVVFGYLYYLGLLVINNGVIRFYFIISMLFGYLVYLNYYSYYMFYVIEAVVKMLKYILSPIIFIFKKINGIIKRMKKVIRWLVKERFSN